MKLGAAGEALIKSFEDLRLRAYPDTGGVPTIGWGHTRGVKLGDTCSIEQARAWFVEDAAEAENDVLRLVRVPLAQHEFDALVSFQFNTGALGKSTLLRRLNAGDRAAAADQFLRWVYDDGVKLAGLVRRRTAERALFLQAA